MILSLAIQSSTGDGSLYLRSPHVTPSESCGTYTVSGRDFLDNFYDLLGRWRRDTRFFSDPDRITDHVAYKALLADADQYIPLIVDELRLGASLLVWVLDDAIDEQPYSSDVVGDIQEMSNGWIAWAERNGRTL